MQYCNTAAHLTCTLRGDLNIILTLGLIKLGTGRGIRKQDKDRRTAECTIINEFLVWAGLDRTDIEQIRGT